MYEPDIDDAVYLLKGVVCLCSHAEQAAEAGTHKYAGNDLGVIGGVIENAIEIIEKAPPPLE